MTSREIVNEVKQIQFAAELESDNAYQCFKNCDTFHGRNYYYGRYAAFEMTKELVGQVLEELEKQLLETGDLRQDPDRSSLT